MTCKHKWRVGSFIRGLRNGRISIVYMKNIYPLNYNAKVYLGVAWKTLKHDWFKRIDGKNVGGKDE